MELTHDFDVSVPLEEAWNVLTDVERIAPCLPGAELHEVQDDEYRGVVKVKVGPITAQYKGRAVFAERDDDTRRAVLQASGRETRGQGNASATITAELEGNGDGTRVRLVTDLTISGKVAQFGRGALSDVSQKLLGQFVENLETTVLAGGPGLAGKSGLAVEPALASEPGTDPDVPATKSVPGSSRQGAADPIDLLDAAGAPVAKRLLPLLGIIAAVVVVLAVLRRRRRP